MSLLSVSLNVQVLEALRDEELALADLSREVGHPPATTLRSYLKALVDLGIIERRQEGGFPGSVAYSLTVAGERFLAIASALQDWLGEAPDGPISLGDPAAKSVIKALVEGWDASIIRVLAARPLALTELAKLITSISYPTLERRLAAMRRFGQVEGRRNSNGSRGTPYEITPWLRQGVSPLVAAVAWEREWVAEQTKALSRIDVEAVFLLAIPLLDLPEDYSGRCRLAVELRSAPQPGLAGAVLTVEEGRPIAWSARLEGDSDGWAGGSASRWLSWMSGRRDHFLELGGDTALVRAVLDDLRQILLPAPRVKAT